MDKPVIEVKHLKTYFVSDRGTIPAVDDVSFTINKGEVLGIVGESGCGKSVTSLSIMGLLPQPPAQIKGGEILFRKRGSDEKKPENLLSLSKRRLRQMRGNDIAMIFQEPMTSLDPLYSIGAQLTEAIKNHQPMSKNARIQKAISMLKLVGIPRAEEVIYDYPHQLSGGMRQRVMIAMAMACDPEVLIADEPTTALDVTIQAQILSLMKTLNQTEKTAILFITHDLGVVADICHRVIVMYAGKIVEQGDVRSILKAPKHPYTRGLIRSLPKLAEKQKRLFSIPGNVPKPGSVQQGCLFAERCEEVRDDCLKDEPKLISLGDDHHCRCFLYHK
ncbi:ABC transporter ATP-binding protein [Bacillus sp. A301a_S52]|nr:ABC transporter ATP-binding protein [Bacillus sp. A301a_S52]